MDKNVKLPAQRLAVQSLPTNAASLPVEHLMDFDIIVTCRYSSKVLAAIDAITNKGICGQGFQVFFDYVLPFHDSCSYDCVMVRLRESVIETMIELTGLGQDDITQISTAANWRNWEAVTGRLYKEEEPASEIASNGKFFLPAFNQQIEECRDRGETVMDLFKQAISEHYGIPMALP